MVKAPKPLALGVAAVTTLNVAALSTSVAVSVPLTEGVPGVALATPPASTTAPLLLPLITAASLVPVMLTCTVVLAPLTRATVKVSLCTLPAANSSCAELAV